MVDFRKMAMFNLLGINTPADVERGTVKFHVNKQSQAPFYFLRTTHLSQQHLFSQWMAQYEKMLRHIIVGFEAKPAIQDELFQEVALNIWKALPSFKGEASAKTFVARIAQNVIASHVAKAVKTIKSEALSEHTPEAVDQTTPYKALDKKQRQQRLSNAIRTLAFEQQQVITLALEGMSYQDMAHILAIDSSLVGVRLMRAKQALAKLLEM